MGNVTALHSRQARRTAALLSCEMQILEALQLAAAALAYPTSGLLDMGALRERAEAQAAVKLVLQNLGEVP